MSAPPPPLPRKKQPFARQAANAGLLAPLIAILMSIATVPLTQGPDFTPLLKLLLGLLNSTLIIAGAVFAIIALVGIPRHGTPGILVKGIAGLTLNGLFLLFFAFALVSGAGKARSRANSMEETRVIASSIRQSVQDSFDPEHGITNLDLSLYEQMHSQLGNASQQLSGDDALLAKAMQNHVGRMQGALERFQLAVKELAEAEILAPANLTNRNQIAERRESVMRLIAVNGELKSAITNANDLLEADLVQLRLPATKVREFMAGFRAQTRPVNELTVQIRACDDRAAQAMLGVLDALHSYWGRWKYDPIDNQVIFEDGFAAEDYQKHMLGLTSASEEQIALQKKLISIQGQNR